MMNRPETRPLLPQTTPMSTFSFAPPNMGFGDTKKNYVFVDEHNRHKRLKVMRACEGCRRRKIKCDAATTNSWPCAACVRLKVNCIPPTVNYNNRTQMGMPSASNLERVLDFATDSGDSSGDESYMTQPLVRNMYHQSPELMASQPAYASSVLSFHGSPVSVSSELHHPIHYDSVTSHPVTTSAPSYHQASYPPHVPSSHTIHIVDTSPDAWPPREDLPGSHLQDVMGELKIDTNALAPYIALQKKTLAETPALEELEYSIPTASTGPGTAVRIPPELMPDDQLAAEYFEIFFTNIHPYVPVISKSYFYQQWNNNRSLISPLLLEAIFACAGKTSQDPAQGAQWLALASKHENYFMDVPRLSTLQALLILLKAREANSKRGYYYRSWMTLRTICSMAKDLELDEHYAAHQAGRPCTDARECLVKTRIWQTIFVAECMVGGAQGRYDMGVELETIDCEAPQTPVGGDDEEYRVSRNFVNLVKVIRNVRSAMDVYRRIKNEKDWNTSPQLTQLNPVFPRWLEEIPADMQIHYPPDGSPPFLQNHFIGNVHCYHHLSILILHRPQLMSSNFQDGSWKQHMSICYQSAKYLCRIQDAIYQTYGIEGFLFMQRGVNFTIYCILTCVVVHMAALTSPDPEFNSDAKEYMTRHMQLLECCAPAWPAPELQEQILSLRQAFSADIKKPFELKPTFPYGSPMNQLVSTPPSEIPYDRAMTSHSAHESMSHFHSQPMTPPISAGHPEDIKDSSMAANSLTMMSTGRSISLPGSQMGDDSNAWNPRPLFEYASKPPCLNDNSHERNLANTQRSQWNTAFGTTSPTHNSSPPPGNMMQPPYSPTASTVSHDLSHVHDNLQQSKYSVTSNMTPAPQLQGAANTYSPPTSHPNSYVSPSMWQDTVASTYVQNGLKRRWDGVAGPAWIGNNEQQMVHI